jgi:hypothetical protein
MAAQEEIMQKRLVKAANAMTEIIAKATRKLKQSQRIKIQQYYE